MLTIQWKGLDKLIKDLATAKAAAVPYAAKTALNTTAFEARRIWQGNIRETFTLRNQFTERSIIAVRASGKGADLQSSVGSFAEYMGDREEDTQAHGRSGSQKAIPAPSAAGNAAGSNTRTRVVRAGNRLQALKVLHPTSTGTKKRRNAIAIALAIRQGKQAVLLERKNGGKGLFSISGGQRRWTGRRMSSRKVKLRMLWDFSRSSVHVPGSHTLQRTMAALEPKLPSIWQAAIVDQFRRHHILGF